MTARFVSAPDWMVLPHTARPHPILGRQTVNHLRLEYWKKPTRSDALRVAVMVPHLVRYRVVSDEGAVQGAGGYRVYEANSWKNQDGRVADVDPRLVKGRSSLSRSRSRLRLA